MRCEPILLSRKSHSGKEYAGAARRDCGRDLRRLFVAKITGARARNAQPRMALLQCRRGLRRDALTAAEQEDRQILRSRAGAKPLDQLDAGDSFAQLRAAPARNREQSDGIAERERGVVDDCAKARVALRIDYHLSP